jgi:hypothetical protein
MIVAQYATIQKRNEERDALIHRYVIDAVLEKHPDALFIGHKANRDYIAYIPHVDDENIFVREQVWRNPVRTSPNLIEEKTWTTTTKRRLQLFEVYSSSRWADWRHGIKGDLYLTGPEIEQAVEWIHENFERYIQNTVDRELRFDRVREGVELVNRIMAIGLTPDHKVKVGYMESLADIPDNLGSTRADRPWYSEVRIDWSRNSNGILSFKFAGSNRIVDRPFGVMGEEEQEENVKRINFRRDEDIKVVFSDPTTLKLFEQEVDKYSAAREIQSNLLKKSREYFLQVQEAGIAAKLEIAKQEFLKERGDLELWERKYKDEAKKEIRFPREIDSIIDFVLGEGVDIAGMTLGEVLDKNTNPSEDNGRVIHEDDLAEMPLDFTFTKIEDN